MEGDVDISDSGENGVREVGVGSEDVEVDGGVGEGVEGDDECRLE